MNCIAPSQRRIRLACVAAAAAWIAALAFSAVALNRTARNQAARERHVSLLEQLEPEMKTLNAYRETLATLKAQPISGASAPDFAAFAAAAFPASRPDALETRTDALPTSGLRMRTSTATWNAITAEALSALVTTAETATPPFTLSAITLAPAGAGERQTFKAEASFTSFIH